MACEPRPARDMLIFGLYLKKLANQVIPFALEISAVPEEAPAGCPVDFRSCKIDIHAIHVAHKGYASMELA